MNAIARPVVDAERRDAHVVAYQRRLLQHLREARRQREAATATARRYQQVVDAAPDRVRRIAEDQAQPIEPVRYNRDVTKAAWTDPEQTNKFSKTAQKVVGFRRVDEMVRLNRRGTLKVEHLAAGMRLRDDYELAEGACISGEPIFAPIQSSGTGATQTQLDAMKRFREAMQAIGKTMSGVVVVVVLENRTVTAWADRRCMSLTRATGYLEAAMDRLVDHYRHEMTSDDILRAQDA